MNQKPSNHTLADLLKALLLPWLLVSGLSGCQLLGGVDVNSVAQTTNKPGQVAVYLSVRDGDRAVTKLEAKNFAVSENDTRLDPSQVQLQLLPRDSVAAQQVLVLVDMSGEIDKPGRRALLAKQLSPFVDRLRQKQNVSVYGFDGGEKLYPLGKFPKLGAEPGQGVPEFPDLLSQKQADSSSNLNGALLTAISQLDFELNSAPQAIKLGRLVVIAGGPDLAGRTSKERLDERLDQVSHHVFALGIEKEPNTGFTEDIGRNGTVLATSIDNMESQLAELAKMIEDDLGQYYLLSYCSPARSGQRLLLVDVTSPQGDGSEDTGSVEIQFSSDGFKSGCDASKIPRFEGAKAQAAAAPKPSPTAPSNTAPATTEPAPANEAPAEVPPPATPAYAE
jgi:hypothetical protein